MDENRLKDELIAKLANNVDLSTLQMVDMALASVLSDYEVARRETQLSTDVLNLPELEIYIAKLIFVIVVREQIEHREERVHMKVGEYLKEQREQQGLSHAKLAKAAGVSKRSLIYWEQGRDMSVEVADKVLKALGATYKIGA